MAFAENPMYFSSYETNRSELDFEGLKKFAQDQETKERRRQELLERERKERERRAK